MSQQAATQEAAQLPAMAGPRLPYHPLIEQRFGIDRASWKALVEAVYPAAKSTESVIMALSYCRARKLDPFKRPVHIVPIWDKDRKRLVETIWPGIGELRTTAQRTKAYAGRDATVFGEMVTQRLGEHGKEIEVTFPEWAQVTVYRMIQGQRVAFEGPQVYWLETFAESKGGAPNAMWRKRPRGQIDKCAEAAALRMAFPEELGEDFIDAEAALIYQHGSGAQQQTATIDAPPRPTRADFREAETVAPPAETSQEEPEQAEAESAQGQPAGNEASGSYTPPADGEPPKSEAQAQDDADYVNDLLQRIEECLSKVDLDHLMNSQAKVIATLGKPHRDMITKARQRALKAIEGGT